MNRSVEFWLGLVRDPELRKQFERIARSSEATQAEELADLINDVGQELEDNEPEDDET